MQQYFSVEGSSYFNLTNINGAVGINSWQQNTIKVHAIIIAETQESRDKIIVERQQQGEKISVYTDYKARAYRHKNTDAVKVDYQVWLSAETNLSDIALVNGSLTIENIHEDLAAEIVNGTVKAMALRGNSKINSVNGSVNVDYDVQNSNIDNIALETVNDCIRLYLPKT